MNAIQFLKFDISDIIKLVSIMIGVFNVLFVTDMFFAYAIVFFEIMVLLFLLFKKKYNDYIGCFLIFYSLCMEFGVFVNNAQFYNFRNVNIAGMNLGIWFLIPLAINSLVNLKISYSKNKDFHVIEFLKKYFIVFIISVIMGVITILLNDNNVQYFPNLIIKFVAEIYASFFMSTVIFLVMLYIKRTGHFDLSKTVNYIIAIIEGSLAQIIVSYIFGIRGFYAGVQTIMSSMVGSMLPLYPVLLVYYFLKKDPNIRISVISIVLSFYCLFLTVINNASGKFIILTLLCPVLLYHVIKRKMRLGWLIFLPIIPILLFVFLYIIESYMSESILLSSKFDQVISLLDFTNPRWFDNMRNSPRFRIAEFVSVVIEYLDKPGYVLLGKGILGTIKDHTNSFGASFVIGTYSEAEWAIGSFYNMHFAPASFLLWGGLLGAYFYLTTVFTNLRLSKESILLLIGTIWFAVYFGYSTTLTVFGSTLLMCGYFEIEKGQI